MPLFNISSNGPIPLAPKSKNGIQIYIRHQDRAKPLEHRIVLAICRYYTDQGTSIKQIVRQSHLSRNTVRKALKALVGSEDVKQIDGKWFAIDYDTGHKGFKVRLFPELKKYEYCVLGLLRSWATNGLTSLTQQGIATQLGLSRRTVYKTVKSLAGDGWIQQFGRSFELLTRSNPTPNSIPEATPVPSTGKPDGNPKRRSKSISQPTTPQPNWSSHEDQDFVKLMRNRIHHEATAMMRKNGMPQHLIDEQLALLDRYGVEIWDGWKACFKEAKAKHQPRKENDPKHCGYLLGGIVKRLIKPRSNADSWEDVCRSELFHHLCYCGTNEGVARRVAARYPYKMDDATRKRLMASPEPLLTDDLSALLSTAA